jgi:hypothetical protein
MQFPRGYGKFKHRDRRVFTQSAREGHPPTSEQITLQKKAAHKKPVALLEDSFLRKVWFGALF